MSVVNYIKDDLSNLERVLNKYDSALADWEDELRLDRKSYGQASIEQAARLGYYDQLARELNIMTVDMELRLRVARAKSLQNIKKASSVAHPEKTLMMMIDGDPAVVSLTKAVLEVRERADAAEGIVEAFQKRGFVLTNLTKIRIAEIHNEIINYNE